MAATLSFVEYLENATSTATPTNLNFGSTLAANISPSLYPVTAGTNSYEKWVKLRFSGSFTRIENLQFWKSAGAYVTGESMNWTGQQTEYAVPTETTSVYATESVPTADPGTANISIGGSLSGSLTATGESDFIILQQAITIDASAGATNQKTLVVQYDEI
jgi:hypothetical protein